MTDNRNVYEGNTGETLAGILILSMILCTVFQGAFISFESRLPGWLAGVAAWISMLILIRRATLFLQVQVGLLFGLGVLMILFSHGKGAEIDPYQTISANTGLLSMIAAVGFLRLVALPQTAGIRRLPVGRRAYVQTLASVGIFSSVINISAPILIADRIHQERPLDRVTTQSVIRAFCAMSNWSPFFGAMAAVLTYVVNARVELIILYCLPFSLLSVTLVYLEGRWRYPNEVADFIGYPLEREALLVPVLLLLSVAITTYVLSDISVLTLIAVCALSVCAVLLIIRGGLQNTTFQLKNHVITYLPRMVGELSLFLSAGVFAVGMSAMIDIGFLPSPFTEFDGPAYVQLLGVMIIAALIGIHPIILVSSLTPMVLAYEPNPTLLAIVYLTAWNLGTGSSYLSGTQLVFQGRYGIPSWKSAIWNWPYALVMFTIASVWLMTLSPILS